MQFWSRFLQKAENTKFVRFVMKDRKHTAAALAGLAVFITAVTSLIVLLFFSSQILRDSGFCLTGDHIDQLMKSQNTAVSGQSVQTRNFSGGSKLFKTGGDTYIRSADGEKWRMADGFPVFTAQGAYLYLYNDKFSYITSLFKLKNAHSGLLIGGGKAYNSSRTLVEKTPILFVKLPNGLYANAQALTVQTSAQTVSIPVNSVLYMDKKHLSYLKPGSGDRAIHSLQTVGGAVLIKIGGQSIAYYDLINRLGGAATSAAASYPVDQTLYQYYFGQQYRYQGKKAFYPYDLGYFMDWDKQVCLIGPQPLYFDDEKKLLLLSDYIVVQPQFSSMYKLPAMSLVFSDKLANYTRSGKKVNTYMQFFLFNGTDTYIFPTGVELNAGSEKISLPAYSCVYVNRDGTAGIYLYGQSYRELKQKLTASVGSGSELLLNQNILKFKNGQQMILFQKPSLLPEDNQKKK